MKDNNDKIAQEQMQVDAEKILNHINYTRHWLEKADDDYKNRRFGNGGVILGLARAELTAAWEEALQLKTQVFRKMPKKAKNMAGWKKSSAAGLMAAGFIMAFMVIQYGNKTITTRRNIPETTTVVLTEQKPLSQMPAASKASAVSPAGVAAAVAAPVADSAAVSDTRATSARKHQAARRAVSSKPAAPAVAKVETPEPVVVAPQPTVQMVEVVRVVEAPQPVAVKARPKLDSIDLYKTADEALKR